MRERKTEKLIDKAFWLFIAILPLITAFSDITHYFEKLEDILDSMLTSNNLIQNTLEEIFGSPNGIFPFFTKSALFKYMSYFAIVELVHLLVDILIYLPRICNKLIHKGEL